MKKLASLILAILLMIALSACGSSKQAAESQASGAARGSVNYDTSAEYEAAAPAQEAPVAEESQKAIKAAGEGRKIIYNANATIDVKDLKGNYDSIISKVKGRGGYIASSSITDNFSEITVRIPSKNLDEFIEYLESLGEGNNEIYRYSDDITEQYTDTESRLRNYKAQEEQLLEVLNKAETVEDILKVQNELFRIRGEIEALQGSINMWDRLVDLSTVTIRLNKIKEIGEEDVKVSFITFDEIGRGMANGFKSTLNFMTRFFSGIFIILVSIVPAIPFIALGVWLFIKLRKRIANKIAKKDEKK